MSKKNESGNYDTRQVYSSARPAGYDEEDVFGNEESHDIRYKTLSWPMVSVLMIAEIVSNGTAIRWLSVVKILILVSGMLSLPSSLAVVYVQRFQSGQLALSMRSY
jgi:hypothetical protein